MGKIITQCGDCKSKFKLDEENIGKMFRCPKCNRVFKAIDISGNSSVIIDNKTAKPNVTDNANVMTVYLGTEESIIKIGNYPPDFENMNYDEEEKILLSQAKMLVEFLRKSLPNEILNSVLAKLLENTSYSTLENCIISLPSDMRDKVAFMAKKCINETK